LGGKKKVLSKALLLKKGGLGAVDRREAGAEPEKNRRCFENSGDSFLNLKKGSRVIAKNNNP